jgi:hypothetical protein
MAFTARNANQRGRIADMLEDLDACSCGHAQQVQGGHAYNEAAFRYFLAIERKRSEVSRRPFLLLLADLKTESGASAQLGPHVTSQLFSGLAVRLRETDFLGWYREEYVVGAVLTQRAEVVSTDAPRLAAERFKKALQKSLAPEIARRLHVRVYQLSAEAPELNETFTDRKNG